MNLANQPFYHEGTGAGACLLIHGLGGGVYELQTLGERLYQKGWTVRGFNLPGHDQPTSRMPDSTWPQWVECVHAEYQHLCQNYEQVAVVGFSNGGLLALHLASQVTLHRLVLLAPFLGMPLLLYPLIYSIGYVIPSLPRLRLPIADPEMEAQARRVTFFQDFNLTAVRSALELQSMVKQRLSQITVPTLVLQSRQDRVVDPQAAWAGFQGLGSPEKQFHWLTDCDHIITLDRQRERVWQLVGDFLLLPGLPLLE
ncbi:carboxylesterase [Gloeomargarita lithophora Alchichica-D10]|uniref:Carboxylesterase n=1 Tax=Gloeomargarita lithophora Alchichica-D10 TaxID=1188229 RepID=A0A1J0A8X9_9CYAN|nr:alpha/beta fold hydrolase [Gloeomargarita lithophora]APB32382.1 carboxylesterase [Gloeomargarita lithophora Alchichica-D10]